METKIIKRDPEVSKKKINVLIKSILNWKKRAFHAFN